VSLSLSPPSENLLGQCARVAGPTVARRHGDLDVTNRAHLHHPPGSALLFPALCKPTGTLLLPESVTVVTGDRGLMMPKRRRTRAQDRAYRIDAERRLNDDLVAERNKPLPF
jgi:hypothetical protein